MAGPTVVSLFAGIGGLDLGFVREGFDLVWANELLKNAAASYELNLHTPVTVGRLEEIETARLPRADVVIGGPPCQSFSLVGLRRANDPRGRLVFTFLDVVKELRPRAFVMENVPGIAASLVDGRRLPDVLVGEFEALGYAVTKMRLLATDFMVPQMRRRLFLVGHIGREIRTPDPERFHSDRLGVDAGEAKISAHAALGDLGSCVARGERSRYRSEPSSWLARYFRAAQAEDVSLHECPRMSATDRVLIAHIPPGGNYRDVPDAVATQRILKFKASGGRSTTYGRLHPDRPSHTVNTYFRRPNVGTNFHYSEDRLLTPREAMRLQSLPDDFELVYSSQDERNALIGNAVPPLMAQAVAWTVRAALTGEDDDWEVTEPLQQFLPWAPR